MAMLPLTCVNLHSSRGCARLVGALELMLFVGVALFIAPPVLANDLVLSAPSLVSKDTPSAGGWDIQFNINWSNSWCDANAACAGAVQQIYANWDAAWVFAKFTKWLPASSSWDEWKHCTIDRVNGSLAQPSGAQAAVGCNRPGVASVDCSQSDAVGMGAFLYRNAEGTGANAWTGAKLRWNYTADSVGALDVVKVKVFGVEMVYIPAGPFKAGDYGTSAASFKEGSSDTDPWSITTDNAIYVTAAVSNGYYYTNTGNGGAGEYATGAVFTIPAAYPKGYGAFYIMKYELSQGMYRDFLNTLLRPLQVNRTASVVGSVYTMSGLASVTNRSGIRNPVSPPSVSPITFGCDYDGAGAFDTATDGEWIAANYLSWGDGIAFADWAGLRPFTELEFEKASRGPQVAIAGEYAWGSTSYDNTVAVDGNVGTKSELPSVATDNIVVSGGLAGPVRGGAFARSTGAKTRTLAGASYYGVMELSGNLWERPVTVGNATGLAFTGIHGNGTLDGTGNANTTNWPLASNATGAGFRGGTWTNVLSYARVSDRYHAGSVHATRSIALGARVARTSP